MGKPSDVQKGMHGDSNLDRTPNIRLFILIMRAHTDWFRATSWNIPQFNEGKLRKMSTYNRLILETLESWPIMPQTLLGQLEERTEDRKERTFQVVKKHHLSPRTFTFFGFSPALSLSLFFAPFLWPKLFLAGMGLSWKVLPPLAPRPSGWIFFLICPWHDSDGIQLFLDLPKLKTARPS